MDVNFIGTLASCQTFAPMMVQTAKSGTGDCRATILNAGSLVGTRGETNLAFLKRMSLCSNLHVNDRLPAQRHLQRSQIVYPCAERLAADRAGAHGDQ